MSGLVARRGGWRRGTWIALAAAALGGLVLPPSAHAGLETGTDLGTEKGLNYRVSVAEDFVGNSFNSFVACLDGARPIAGGIDLEFSAELARMGSTYPAQEGDLLEWRSQGYNLLGGTMDMSFFAVCRKVEPSMWKFRSASKPVASAAIETVKAACKPGFEVTGGGLQSANPRVLASAPYDGGDKDKKPDDGWKATALNDDPSARDLLAYASCRKAGTWDLQYLKTKQQAIGSDASAASTDVCTDGVVTGGGASIVGTTGLTRLHESYPADFGDADETPADAWTSSLRNGSGAATSGTFYAICKN
jgi:hypothetical protein